jgi:hypothetical protein
MTTQSWQPIATAPRDGRLWEVSTYGRVRVDGESRNYYLSKGYAKITMGGRTVSIHRLVAAAFIPNPDGLAEVNHINGVKHDNHVANLEWCSRSQNMKHAYAAGLHPGVSFRGPEHPNFGKRGALHPQSMPVRAVFADGSTRDFASQSDAALQGFRANKISMCICGHNKTHAGAKWMPLPEPPTLTERGGMMDTCAVHRRADCGCPDPVYQGVIPARPRSARPRCPVSGCDYPAGIACTNALCPGRWPRRQSPRPIPTDRASYGSAVSNHGRAALCGEG